MSSSEKDFYKISRLLGLGNFQSAKIEIKKSIKKYPNTSYLNNLYGLILDNENKFEESIAAYKKAINLDNNYFEAHYNMGNSFLKNRMPKKAVESFKNATKMNPNSIEAHIGLGNSLKYINKIEEAVLAFKKILEINPNFAGGYILLGSCLQDNKQFEDAIPYLKKFGRASKARVLECLYSLKKIEEYKKYLSELSKKDPTNIRAATISTFASHQLNLKEIHPFCKKPFDFVSITNIKSISKSLDFNNLSNEISEIEQFWEPSGFVTKKAFKTHGNIFDHKKKSITALKEIILTQIEKYKIKHSQSKNTLITHWPTNFNLYGWHVKYKKLGHQSEHIHPDGWISGSFYIKIPKKKKNNETAIKFSLHGFDYPIFNKKIPYTEHLPNKGDLVLFPSSLFHSTIPCPSNEERHMIAFDVRPS
mgnify:CR=1 FL=1|tara:strand:+ start:3750 stop:5009 length:1260 start_codon:yes stop_codon:yes gene_type:complete